MKRVLLTTLVLGCLGASFWSVQAQQAATDGPRYVNGNNLVRPGNYRDWRFLGSGIDMTYEPPEADAKRPQSFSNVFVNPGAYDGFMKTGKWPDGSVFVLEIRRAASEGAINGNTTARYQTNLVAIEAEVKDSRFADGWAFYDFGGARNLQESSAPLSGDRVAGCIECHTKNTAVERTFVQFYPTLLEVARKMGTVKAGY